MAQPSLVCDTSVLLYLGRIEHLFLLPQLFAQVWVPDSVVFELDVGRLSRSDTVDPRQFAWVTIVAVTSAELATLPVNRLGMGERAVIAWACAQHGAWTGLDDAQARHLAGQLGLTTVGTVGILIQAKRLGLIPQIRSPLTAVMNSGFRLSEELRTEALRLAGEMES